MNKGTRWDRLILITLAQVSHYRPFNQVDQDKSRYISCRQAVIKIHNGKVTLVVVSTTLLNIKIPRSGRGDRGKQALTRIHPDK
jgi:hypothetical protein